MQQFSSTGGRFLFYSVEKVEMMTLYYRALKKNLDLKSTIVKGTGVGWGVRSDTFHQEDSQKSLMGEYQMCLWR